MAQPYQLTTNQNGGVLRISDGAFIPADPRNADYQAYEAWVAAGNTADPVPPQTWAQFKGIAGAALAESDKTMVRIQEAIALALNTWTSADVVAWVNYRRALRAIVASSTGTNQTLPTQPAYPAGT